MLGEEVAFQTFTMQLSAVLCQNWSLGGPQVARDGEREDGEAEPGELPHARKRRRPSREPIVWAAPARAASGSLLDAGAPRAEAADDTPDGVAPGSGSGVRDVGSPPGNGSGAAVVARTAAELAAAELAGFLGRGGAPLDLDPDAPPAVKASPSVSPGAAGASPAGQVCGPFEGLLMTVGQVMLLRRLHEPIEGPIKSVCTGHVKLCHNLHARQDQAAAALTWVKRLHAGADEGAGAPRGPAASTATSCLLNMVGDV